MALTNDEFVKRSNVIHKNFYDYIEEYKNSKTKINTKNKLSFSELYKKTMDREFFLKSKGYNIISIWEDEFIKQNKK
jgi:hypothetical protein